MKKLIYIYLLFYPLNALPMQKKLPNITLVHYELKLKPPQKNVIIKYEEDKSVFERCAALKIDIKRESLKKVHASLQEIHPAIFELMCGKQNKTTQLFMRIAKLPEDVENKILTEYVFEGDKAATNIFCGCSERNPKNELSYKAAIKRFYSRKIKKPPFLTLGEMYYLSDEHVTLCEHIEKSHTDNTIRLDLTQEQTLRTIPAHIKQKMITLKVLCKRPWIERFWLAWGATKKEFSSMIEAIEAKKPKISFNRKKEDAWIEAFQFGATLIFALSAGIHKWWISGYDFPHSKAMKDFTT